MASGKRGWFYGWYFKCQSDTQTLAVIPAVHQTGRNRTCSVQIITEKQSWTVPFPGETFRRKGKTISIGKNRFGEKGIRLAVCAPGLKIKGRLAFGPLSPLRYDIMGPFALVPFMECRHSIWSMKHAVKGTVSVNGEKYSFDNAVGYWEGDKGRSFPKEYIWTQCSFPEDAQMLASETPPEISGSFPEGAQMLASETTPETSGSFPEGAQMLASETASETSNNFPEDAIMLSVADIPLAGFHFRGILGVILLNGKEYRLATYLGAKAARIRNGLVRITQGSLELEAELLERTGKPLKAPAKGDMVRTIHESAACRAGYRFRSKGRTLLAFETDRASFEYEYRT